MIFRCAALLAALFLFFISGPAVAQDVTLKSQDGSVELSGTLLGFDGEFYRVDTIYGELTIDGTGVTCEGPGCPNLQNYVAEISISGSASMGAVLVPALLEGFAAQNNLVLSREDPDQTHFVYTARDQQSDAKVASIYFRITNSEEGFADLLANEADIVMSLREVNDQELARARDAGLGDLEDANRSRVLSLDAIVPIVSPRNPVQAISPRQVARVYSGEIISWSSLGGPDAPIILHAPSERTGLGQAIQQKILEPERLAINPRAIRHERSNTLAKAVENDPFAFGLVSFAEVADAKPLVLTGPCGRSLRATRRTIKTEDYPLTAPMFLYTPARRLPKIARDFLAYTREAEAHSVIRRVGFVDQAPEEIRIDLQGNRLANAISAAGRDVSLPELQRMMSVLDRMQRLTTSFRFEAGSARLDAQSRSNVLQLSRLLEQGRFDARQVLFAGFSDAEGPGEANRQIAFERAEAVRDAVLQAAETADLEQIEIVVDAFGEAMPMACDTSAWGRQVNRRVEVWVR